MSSVNNNNNTLTINSYPLVWTELNNPSVEVISSISFAVDPRMKHPSIAQINGKICISKQSKLKINFQKFVFTEYKSLTIDDDTITLISTSNIKDGNKYNCIEFRIPASSACLKYSIGPQEHSFNLKIDNTVLISTSFLVYAAARSLGRESALPNVKLAIFDLKWRIISNSTSDSDTNYNIKSKISQVRGTSFIEKDKETLILYKSANFLIKFDKKSKITKKNFEGIYIEDHQLDENELKKCDRQIAFKIPQNFKTKQAETCFTLTFNGITIESEHFTLLKYAKLAKKNKNKKVANPTEQVSTNIHQHTLECTDSLNPSIKLTAKINQIVIRKNKQRHLEIKDSTLHIYNKIFLKIKFSETVDYKTFEAIKIKDKQLMLYEDEYGNDSNCIPFEIDETLPLGKTYFVFKINQNTYKSEEFILDSYKDLENESRREKRKNKRVLQALPGSVSTPPRPSKNPKVISQSTNTFFNEEVSDTFPMNSSNNPVSPQNEQELEIDPSTEMLDPLPFAEENTYITSPHLDKILYDEEMSDSSTTISASFFPINLTNAQTTPSVPSPSSPFSVAILTPDLTTTTTITTTTSSPADNSINITSSIDSQTPNKEVSFQQKKVPPFEFLLKGILDEKTKKQIAATVSNIECIQKFRMLSPQDQKIYREVLKNREQIQNIHSSYKSFPEHVQNFLKNGFEGSKNI